MPQMSGAALIQLQPHVQSLCPERAYAAKSSWVKQTLRAWKTKGVASHMQRHLFPRNVAPAAELQSTENVKARQAWPPSPKASSNQSPKAEVAVAGSFSDVPHIQKHLETTSTTLDPTRPHSEPEWKPLTSKTNVACHHHANTISNITQQLWTIQILNTKAVHVSVCWYLIYSYNGFAIPVQC